ncbi:gamma-glutamyl hydrolase 2-like protein [Tanacetum coccineum]|uniref:Gamma-glutamyl hydrolase 2-like protein n=1 Tax=Tanacetum coccineum TaxID=301880 RepID=A0ABQ5GK27_9ASTR
MFFLQQSLYVAYLEYRVLLVVKLNLVNGVLFTGGWSKTGLYFDVIEEVFNQVLKKNDAGEHFPLLAICLDFELVTMIVSKINNILEAFSASDQASTLQFMNNINIEETLFQRFPSELVAKLSTEFLLMQNHKLRQDHVLKKIAACTDVFGRRAHMF